MRVDSNKFFVAFFIFVAVVFGLGVQEYYSSKSSQITEIQTNLLNAASSASIVAGDNYLERLVSNEITPVESALFLKKLTALAQSHHSRQLYNVFVDTNNTLRYGLGNSDQSFLQILTPVVENREKLIHMLEKNHPTFQLDNELGSHALYLPNTTVSGIRYLSIAVSEPISLTKSSQEKIISLIGKASLLFLGLLPLLILYRSTLADTTERLNEEMEMGHEKLIETTILLNQHVEQKTKELIDEGFVDHLTHLNNRYRLFFDLDRNAYRALIIIHIKNLQEINHFFGPAITDSLRQQFAILLVKLDLNAYRLGRDEFALLINQTSISFDMNNFTQFLLDSINDHTFTVLNETIKLSTQMGIDTSKELSLSNADKALSYANEHSLDYSIYKEDKELEKHQRGNLLAAASIREAYYNGRMICYYQPIVSTHTGKIIAYETLARLIDKDSSLLSPIEFLEIAKKTALYPEISREIIRQACESFESREENFSIHIGSFDFMNQHTVRYIEEISHSTQTTEKLIFELAEEDIYAHYDEAKNFIDRMKLLGVKISIDNFGATSSNQELLLNLSIDYVKINGAIVQKVASDKRYIKVVESIISFAEALGAQSVAENVEDEEIFNLLKLHNIPYAQGFYIGKPRHLI